MTYLTVRQTAKEVLALLAGRQEWLIEQKRLGVSDAAIAARLGCSGFVVWQSRRNLGIPARTHEPANDKCCSICGETKPLNEYAQSKSHRHGVSPWCKACTNAYASEWRRRNRARIRASQLYHKKIATAGGIERLLRNKRLHNQRHPDRYRARRTAQYALQKEALIRQTCETCGSPHVEMHHDDYAKPLAVRWLCRLHHQELHGRRSEQGSPV